MSTENTLAPSFARSAASGRPTTSDLYDYQHLLRRSSSDISPVNHGDYSPVSTVSVRQDPVVYPNVFKTFHDSEWGARYNRFDHTRRRRIAICSRSCDVGWQRGRQSLRRYESDTWKRLGRARVREAIPTCDTSCNET